jgi:hypothetical protein
MTKMVATHADVPATMHSIVIPTQNRQLHTSQSRRRAAASTSAETCEAPVVTVG